MANVPSAAKFPYIRRMTTRPLTIAERVLSHAVFGDAIDPDRVRVHRARWFPLQPRNVVMAPDGAIWCHPDGVLYRACYAAAPLDMRALFVHEMVHVWQAQTRGRWYLPLMRHPFCRYAYRLDPGRPFARYGIEQQAEMVADAFLVAHGIARPGGLSMADYRAVLPFPIRLGGAADGVSGFPAPAAQATARP
jgi:hypothetical protein